MAASLLGTTRNRLRIADCGLRIFAPAVRMDAIQFETKTKAFGLRVIRLVEAQPKEQTAAVIGHQRLL
jgi:hypothetical protein